MLKTIIVLPDGREITSGTDAAEAVQSMTFTESVNDSVELRLGSACSNMVELTLITPGGSLPITAGDELTVYKEKDGIRYKWGLFTTEKPTRPSANTMQLTAFDRISWLDKDLTKWLAGLNGWPYSLLEFAQMVCDACGLKLINQTIPNGEYLVQGFSADGITGRQLIRWVGEIAGRFCRATPDGDVEFAWYTPVEGYTIGETDFEAQSTVELSFCDGDLMIASEDIGVTHNGDGNVTLTSALLSLRSDGAGNGYMVVSGSMETLFYYLNGLSFEDYAVHPIEKVQLRQNEEDVGTVFPDRGDVCNTYTVTGNYLLTATDAEDLEPVAECLYEQLKHVTYTPCKVTVPANVHIRAGHQVQILDSNGRTLTAYVMTRTQSGQRDVLECTGNYLRESSGAVNNQSFKAYMGKVLNLRTDVEGLKAEHKDAVGNLAKLTLELEGITAQVSKQLQEGDSLKQTLTQVTQNAESLSVQVQNIRDNGTAKLKTGKGYTFDDEGLKISNEGGQISNLLDHTGMYVKRGSQTLLKTNKDGVEAIDITVNNYLQVGQFARFEDYTNGADSGRTACFFT